MKIKNILLLLVSLLWLTSCEPHWHFGPGYGDYEDSDRGYVLTGRWFGDLGVMIDNRPAEGSVLEFVPDNYSYSYGYGVELDYYYDRFGHLCAFKNRFNWEIRNRSVYLFFDDPALDCRISNYRLSATYFSGYLVDNYGVSTPFNLRNYDRYWDDFGYGTLYAVPRTVNDSTSVSSDLLPSCVRRVSVASEKE